MRVLALSVLVLVTAGLAFASQADEERLHFRVDTDVVRLDAVVTTREGRSYPGLDAEDFEVLEDGVPQEIAFFTSETSPVKILLLLDVSSSIRPSMDGIKSAAYRFLGALREGDGLKLGFFNQDLWLTGGFIDDKVALAREIQSMRAGGMTALYDAILTSLKELDKNAGRKALVIFADGDDSRPAAEGSLASRDDAIEAGRASEVSIYAVGFRGGRTGRGVNREFLRTLASESGGQAFFTTSVRGLRDSFAKIQTELHSQYRLGYVPSNPKRDGAWREIEVRIAGTDDLVVRARKGYYAKPSLSRRE